MLRLALRILWVLLAVTIPVPALATGITYQVDRVVQNFTITGFITTDGTLGELAPGDINDWNITLAPDDSYSPAPGDSLPIVLTPQNSRWFKEINAGFFVATETQLLAPEVGNFVNTVSGLLATSPACVPLCVGGWFFGGFINGGGPPMLELVQQGGDDLNQSRPFTPGEIVAVVVPEPSTDLLFAAALLVVGAYLRQHREASSRRARRGSRS